MPDAGLPVRFGWFLVPDAADPQGLVAEGRLAERAGFDLIGIQDHPYQRRYLDTFTLLATLATATERIGLFPDVASLPLRHPAMLAKAAASVDLLSGGRFELGLGAGAFWDAVAAMGGPRRRPGEAVEALEEAIGLLRDLWSDKPSVRFEGAHVGSPAREGRFSLLGDRQTQVAADDGPEIQWGSASTTRGWYDGCQGCWTGRASNWSYGYVETGTPAEPQRSSTGARTPWLPPDGSARPPPRRSRPRPSAHRRRPPLRPRRLRQPGRQAAQLTYW